MGTRNIVIYSDGTGQRSGVLVDEDRSNIYKLYRATRCGPDSCVDPKEQLAFYDPGIGTLPPEGGLIGKTWRRIYNLVSQALGMGLTGNIIDCYAAIIRMWRPGDQIFLFGFSRGAYTVRCLGAVIALCGVPTREGGEPVKVDEATSKRLASEAVKSVYQHTSSWKKDTLTTRQSEMLEQRIALSKAFRRKYASGTDEKSNVYPHFIGVFDTVASLANPHATLVFAIIAALFVAAASFLLWHFVGPIWLLTTKWHYVLTIVGMPAAIALAIHLWKRVKWEIGLPHAKWWRPFHLAEWRMNFYDQTLNPNVGYARHAISIDEARGSFQREPWGDREGPVRDTGINEHGERNPPWLVQLWFAGNHSDVGGSYPENRSRLSDISLKWMLEAAAAVGLKYDTSLIRMYPASDGPQHDETRAGIFKYASKNIRILDANAPLHSSVLERLQADEVLQHDHYAKYRPEGLRNHTKCKKLYETE